MPEKTFHQQIGSIAGRISYATRTPEQEANRKAAAAAGRMKRFLDQVPAEITDEKERMKKALQLQRAHMQKIAMKSAQSPKRRSKKAA